MRITSVQKKTNYYLVLSTGSTHLTTLWIGKRAEHSLSLITSIKIKIDFITTFNYDLNYEKLTINECGNHFKTIELWA